MVRLCIVKLYIGIYQLCIVKCMVRLCIVKLYISPVVRLYSQVVYIVQCVYGCV